MPIRLLGNRVAVKPDPKPTETQGGLYIPDTTSERPMSGKVVAVGPEEMGMSVGDTVIYSKTAGTEIEVDDEKLLVMFDDEVMAVVDPI